MKNPVLRPSVALLLAALPLLLSAQSRQLSEQDLAKLRRSVEASKADSIEAQRQAELARQREALRLQEEALEDDDEYWEPDPPQPAPRGVFEAFTSTLGSEMAKKQQEEAQQQRFLEGVRRQAEAADRQRQNEQERQRLAQERARLERQAQQQQVTQRQAAGGGVAAPAAVRSTGGGKPGSAVPAPQQAGKSRDEMLRANVAAERKRLLDERERAAAAERGRSVQPVAGKPPAVAGQATAVAKPKASAAPPEYGPAKAWCQASNAGTYQCMGPLQNLLSWYPSLDVALSQSGCPGGEGYPPTRGHGGSSFNCGRPLKVNDYRMPTYDPYRGGGRPVLVKFGE